MEALFTETLKELLENQGYGTDSQSQSLTDILSIMGKFPNFVFGENINLSMLDLFIDKYDIKEIGSETEELFMHFWKERAQELLLEYTPKIQMWLDNFNDLFKFTVKLEISDISSNVKTEDKDKTRTDNLSRAFSNTRDDNLDENNENTYYLNPVNTSTTNLKPQEVYKNKKSNTGFQYNHGSVNDTGTQTNVEDNTIEESKERTISRDVLQSVWGKTRAQLLKQILELQQVYNMCIRDFATIFMGVL